MIWIDESRREAFEHSARLRAERTRDRVGGAIRDDLERILPDDVKKRALPIGNELLLPYEDALTAVAIATSNQIAVLGFDAREIFEDGFQASEYTGYDRDIRFTGDWKAYVAAINAEAEKWIREHPLGRNHGYILTSTSEKEFAHTKKIFAEYDAGKKSSSRNKS